jgi:hypothetical protein
MPLVTHNQKRRLYYWGGIFAVVVSILLLIVLLSKEVLKDQRQVPAFVGGYCAILGTILSLFLIMEHLACFFDPDCQTKVVRILFMVPLYSMISWLSILFPSAATYLDLVRDAYESYAIYAFFSLMLALMGGMDVLYRTLMVEERDPVTHFAPFCWMEPFRVSPRFIQSCRRCLFQFMVLKPFVTLVVIILNAKGLMGDSVFDVTRGGFWTALIYNVSITIALYGLAYFYSGTKGFLEGKGALAKFLCIKAIIFLSYWQGFIILILAAADVLPTFNYWTKEEAPVGLQDFLICIEMLLVSFAHKFCFGSDEFAVVEESSGEGTGATDGVTMPGRYIPPARKSAWANLKYTLRHEDLIAEIKDIMRNR